MKKIRYSFISLLLVVICATVNAQVYTETFSRTSTIIDTGEPLSSVNWAKQGGTTTINSIIKSVKVAQRGVDKFSHTTQSSDFSYQNGNAVGVLLDGYLDLSDEMVDVEIVAGQEFTISAFGEGQSVSWANAVAYVDWDGNGAFDDHELKKYNLYDISSVNKVEFAAAQTKPLDAKWNFLAPNVTEERLVRIRIRYDEAINETVSRKKAGILDWANKSSTTGGIPECNMVQALDVNYQTFSSMFLNRFTPSGQFAKGTTVDLTVKIVPDPYATAMQEMETVVGAGNVGATCQSTQGTAITDAAGFAAFMSATSGDYYLANDITLTSLPVSQGVFTGTFDGNGHTITFASNATADFHNTSKDKCFYPYGSTDEEIGENLFGSDVVVPNYDMTNYPARAIAGGFCGVLEGGTIKNVKIVYAANATYKNNATEAPIFGLVAGINRGRIENVSVDVQTGKTITLQNSQSPTASAFGGITGLLHWGIVKHCAVNVDGTINHTSAAAMQETLTSAFIGRLQAGVVSNVKFSGNGVLYANSAVVANVRNYMGGIAGMTHTPQGEFCGNQEFEKQLKSWGFDNGTVGIDVNNVIVSYSGAMNMASAANNNSYAYHCRGLLFGEAHDTIVVPNLITQYATAPTIEKEAPADASLTNIPLISKTKGLYNALVPNGETSGVTAQNTNPRLMGKLFLYKSGVFTNYKGSKDNLFTNVNIADTELDWAYEFDPNICTYYSTPYAVATYIGTNANIQGIEAASANVSDLGSAVVKIDPQPETVASPSWTWSETVTPPAADPIETPICGGGSCVGTPIKGLLSTYCSSIGINTNAGTDRNISTVSLNGQTITVNENSSRTADTYRGFKNDEATAIELVKGTTYTLRVEGGMNWTFITCFADWNADGDFSDTGENLGILPAQASSFNNDNTGSSAFREFSITVPTTATTAYIPLRVKMAYSCNNSGTAFNANPCALSGNETSNQSVAADIVLKIVNTVGEVTCIETTYCTPVLTNVSRTDPVATGFLSSLTVNDATTPLYTSTTATIASQQSGGTITINQNESLKLDFEIGSNWNEGMKWTFAVAFVDLNGDGDFSDSGERIYEQGGTGSEQWTGTKIDAKPWNTTKTITFDASATNSMLRIFTIGEYNSGFAGSTNGSMAIYNTGCNTVAPNGTDGEFNKFHCYDFPIVINSAGGDGCAYVANFGNVCVGDVVTYDIKLGAGSVVDDDDVVDVADDEYELTYNNASGILTVTYTVPTTPGAVAVDSIGGITKDGVVYRIAVSATVKAAPTVTFRMSDEGGGALSLDMGKTTFIEARELAPYKGELLTAVPVGPTHIVGWYVSTDGGTTFNAVGHTNPDYTYTGADDAIVEVRFNFDDFEGTFGNSRFTDKSNVPFYISAISTTNGIVNVNATNVFIEDSVREVGKARWRYMENQRLQTLHNSIKILEHEITVTVQNANKIPADARLMCFVDYNMNNYFDFASSPDGLASALSENGELVFVADPNDTDAEQTFTFTISNAGIDKFGKTRMRFMVATYVDMFGLGPVNQYGNYQPRFDTDGDGKADTNLPLNDNNGSLYTPNNQCRLENYVNVADVTFEVVAFVRYNDKHTIKNGESVRMKNLYIEAMEDETGFHAGQIVFNKNAPYGSLIVEGNIIIRRRIYPDKWHDLSFPIEMQGVGDKDGVCAVGENGALKKLPATGKHLLYEFDPAGRNQTDGPTGGYNHGTHESSDDTFKANKFYEFAADVPDGFTANNAGDGIDGVNSYWIQFHSVDTGFVITPSAAKTATLSYTRDEDAAEYWNRNVFTIYNPFLSNINVNEITASLGWENITWWNAVQNRYVGVSAAQPLDMPPHFGYWIQFTEGIGSNTPVEILLGDASRNDYPYADDRIVNFVLRIAAQAPTFDTPDSYTLGIDAAENASNETAVSSTIVTLTDEGSIDNFRAGYDMPASFAAADAEVPEIWTKAGESNMMFNDVRRADEVVVPVGIRIKEAGEYAVRLTHTNDTTSLVQLRDKETGAIVDLQSDGEESSYLFLADEGDANRFELVISKAPQMVTDLEFVETLQGEGEAQVYVIGDNLCLKNIAMGYSVSVCDVLGREYLRTLVTEADMKVLLPAMRGVYIVNILDKQNISVQSVKVTK